LTGKKELLPTNFYNQINNCFKIITTIYDKYVTKITDIAKKKNIYKCNKNNFTENGDIIEISRSRSSSLLSPIFNYFTNLLTPDKDNIYDNTTLYLSDDVDLGNKIRKRSVKKKIIKKSIKRSRRKSSPRRNRNKKSVRKSKKR
jgi:hypothetical protein